MLPFQPAVQRPAQLLSLRPGNAQLFFQAGPLIEGCRPKRSLQPVHLLLKTVEIFR